MKMTFKELLASKIPVIYDGAMGTELQKHALSADDFAGKDGCNEMLNITRPDIVRSVHTSYLLAGAHVVETNTFGGSGIKLAEYGIAGKVAEINRAAARIAREAIEECGNGHPAFVAGSMGPTGYLPSSPSLEIRGGGFDEIAAAYAAQAQSLMEGGVDILLLETMQDLLELRAALYGIRQAFASLLKSVPVQVQVTMDASGHMLLGSDIAAFLGAVAGFSPTVAGLNCSTGPAEMTPYILALASGAPCAVSAIPNAGMPRNVDGHAVYAMDPPSFAAGVASLVADHGVAVVGGCCGTSPAHIAALSAALAGVSVAPRPPIRKYVFLGTSISGVALCRGPLPIIIGERLNVQGSKKTKELVLADDYDELSRLGQEQLDSGAHILDLCVAVNERDAETATMEKLTRHLSERLSTGLCIDSTDPAVFEAALRVLPGAALLNSVNLEQGGAKARRILASAAAFGCPVIALPIDDTGMARSVDEKLTLCRVLRTLIVDEYGIPEHHIFFDPLVFTLATGDAATADAAVQSLEALRRIRAEFPDMHTTMGVSNVSFGLKPAARRILNNLMLHYAAAAGLSSAIFNPLHLDDVEKYDPSVRKMAEDLLFNRQTDALAIYTEYFEKINPSRERESVSTTATDTLAPAEQLRRKVLSRDRRGLANLITRLLADVSPDEILKDILLPAMAEVGERMAKGDMILPFVLQAAEVMKEASTILEPHFAGTDRTVKGRIVLATVYGDIHDIGKNLVGSILKNQGYEIVDLGKQVPVDAILEAIRVHQPTAVGLSALLVSTSRMMGETAKAMDAGGCTLPLLIGGAAVNREFATRVAAVAPERNYAGGVYFAKDAFEAMRVLEDVKGRGSSTVSVKHSAASAPVTGVPREESSRMPVEPVAHGELLVPSFMGTSAVLRWDAAQILESMNRDELYKGYWRGGALPPEKYAAAVRDEFEPALQACVREILDNGIVDAAGLYGFYPVYTDDTRLFILDPSDHTTEIAQFDFPRVARKGNRSIADYFRPEGDVAGFIAVTIGSALAQRCAQYFEKEDRYSSGFFLNGLGSQLVEDLADKVTAEVRRALLIDRDRGKRYGFGYPGLPPAEQNVAIGQLLGVEERLSMQFTSAGQIIPEHSTITMFCAYNQAEYLG